MLAQTSTTDIMGRDDRRDSGTNILQSISKRAATCDFQHCGILASVDSDGPMQVSKSAKIRNRYNQVPHLTQDTNGKVANTQTPQTRATSF